MARFPTLPDRINPGVPTHRTDIFPPAPPRSVSFTTPTAPTGDPTGGMTLDALMARQKEIAARQAELGGPNPQNSTILGGLGTMFDRFTAGFEGGQARAQERAGRELMAEILAGVDPVKGATSEQIAALSKIDNAVAMKLYEDNATRAQKAAEAAATGAPKMSDVATLRGDYDQQIAYKNYENAKSMWTSMQDAAQRNTPQADLNMVIALAKMYDPGSVVRTEEGKMVLEAAGAPASVMSAFQWLTGSPDARLDKTVRRGMMEEAMSRMKGYSQSLAEQNQRYTGIAGRYNVNPADVVSTMPAPIDFDLEKVVGPDPIVQGDPATPQPDVPDAPEVPPYPPKPANYDGEWPTPTKWQRMSPEVRQFYINAAGAAQ